MKKWLSLLLILVLAFTVVACSSNDSEESKTEGESTGEKTTEEATEEASGDMPMVGATIYKYDDNFMSFVRRSLEKEAEGKVMLEVVDSQNDQGKQQEQIDNFLSKGSKALAINLVNQQAAANVIEKIKGDNIPVVFFNREPSLDDLNSYEHAYYVGTTSSESGIMQGEIVAESWKANPTWDKNGDGKIQYVLLKGEAGHPDAEARTEYVVKAINDAGIETEELALEVANWDTTQAKEKMDAWLAKHGENIEYVIANNDGMALGAITALQAKGYFTDDKFMPVVGVDAIPDALAKIKEGTLVGSVLNDAANQGKATMDLTINLANGKDPLEGTEWELTDKAVRVPYVKITMDNIDVAEAAYTE